MFNLTETSKKMILVIFILFLISLVGGYIYYRNANNILPYIFGLILGALISVLKVVLIEKTIDKALDLERKQAQNVVSLAFVLRHFITAVPLLMAAFIASISIWGTAIGIILLPTSAYVVSFFIRRVTTETK